MGSTTRRTTGQSPDGTRVAWLGSSNDIARTLSTTIAGLVVGTHYPVQFRANAALTMTPSATLRLNGGAPMSFTAAPSVGGSTGCQASGPAVVQNALYH